jgi:rubrerythrin
MAKNTEESLLEAFAGESQANRRYLAFAKQAKKEGFPQIAHRFRAIAEAETVHAHNHLRNYGGIKNTLENLKVARDGEHYEFTTMYPEFIEIAKKENEKKALRDFDYANQVEKIHYELYTKAIEAVEKGTDLQETSMFICDVCGYTCEDETPDKCPICGASHKRFTEIK